MSPQTANTDYKVTHAPWRTAYTAQSIFRLLLILTL